MAEITLEVQRDLKAVIQELVESITSRAAPLAPSEARQLIAREVIEIVESVAAVSAPFSQALAQHLSCAIAQRREH